jgi:hypothetical protein
MDNPNGIKLDVDGMGVYSMTSTIKSNSADAMVGLVVRICLVLCSSEWMFLLLLDFTAALSVDDAVLSLRDNDVVDTEDRDCFIALGVDAAFSTGLLRAVDSKQRNIK